MIFGRRPPAWRFCARRSRRGFPSRALDVALVLAHAATASGALAQSSAGFRYCAPPARPACVESRAEAARDCERAVEAYVATVFHYRECLARESERAIYESNDVIDQWRCRQNAGRCRK